MKRPVDDILTIEELSAYLKISLSMLYKLAREGKIPGNKVGRHWRFHKPAIDRWLSAGRISAPGSKEKRDPASAGKKRR